MTVAAQRTPKALPKRVFISDLHLGDAEQRKVRFLQCLGVEARWADEIFILGDLFEAWVGDDDDAQLAETVCDGLKQASRTAALRFMPGNRDFLCGAGFAARSGAVLIEDPFLTSDGLVLAHGDALCTEDSAYQRLRREVRRPAWRADMLAKPLVERRQAARQLRDANTAAKANKADNIMDVNAQAAAELLDALGGRALIHGHTHRPGLHRSNGAVRYVLGDWNRCGWLLRQSGRRLQLECFSLARPYPGA